MLNYSPKQLRLAMTARGPAETVLASGPVRTGKTTGTAAAYMIWTGARFYGHRFLIASKSMTHIRESILPELYRVADDIGGVKVIPRYQDKVILIGEPPHFNRHVMMDFQTVASVGKIQGQTYAGAWINEAGLAPREFVSEVHARCASVPGSKVFMDSNPEGPRHWLATEHKDRPETADIEFQLRPTCDNPTLSEAAIQKIEKAYPAGSIQHKRKILGLWEAAAGLVYPAKFRRVEQRPAVEPSSWELSVDGGIKTVTHADLIGNWPEASWFAEHYRYDTRTHDPIPDSMHAANIREMVGTRPISRIVIDRFAQTLKMELGLMFPGVPIAEADNYPHSIRPGIDLVVPWMANGVIRFDPVGAKPTTDEMDEYEWDQAAEARGITIPVKTSNIHGLDTMRYWVVEANKGVAYEFEGAA